MSNEPDRRTWRRSGGSADPGGPPEPPAAALPIGPTLAAAREARGLSVEDVSSTTRIRAALIRAVERDDFAPCGGAFYARAHIRTIARLVDADADALVAEFDRRNGPVVPEAEEIGAALRPPPAGRTRRHGPRWIAAAVVVLLVLVAVLVGRWARGSGGSDDPRAATPVPISTVTAKPTPRPKPTTVPRRPAPAPAPTSVSVLLSDTGTPSWILVTSSTGNQVYQGVLEAGAAMRFSDPTRLTVRFGNAPGVAVRLNGQPMVVPCPKAVCTVHITPTRVVPTATAFPG